MKIKSLLKKPRIIILILFILGSLLVINPQLDAKGVTIKNVVEESAAEIAGIEGPSESTSQTNYEKILEINGEEIRSLQDYQEKISEFGEGSSIRIKTNKDEYIIIKTLEDIGLIVQEASSTNLKLGLELQGGTRVILRPETQITEQQRDELIQIMEYRLNTYGLSDIEIRKADGQSTLLGGQEEKYVIVEIAGATQEEVSELIASQGLFEAKIQNQTVFSGGEDITFVCRNDGTCSGVSQCSETQEGYACRFEFLVHLSDAAAQRHADVTRDLEVVDNYLSEQIEFYLDGELVDSLNIGSDLRGIKATQIQISGPGVGETEQEAVLDAINGMNKLQTILLTGSLPVDLEIVKFDTISPVLGEEFVRNAIIMGLLAILAVSVVIFARYRNLKISIPVFIALLSEVVIILGISALTKYNLDLAAIAGIIAAVGTGVDDNIVIIDEVTTKESGYSYKWKEKLKKAFFIIFAAYVTTLAAMFPLLRAGAGLLRGFALITIIGVTVGVFITRPAFAVMIKKLTEE
jgi:preprotein translocase subunit SecD